MFGSLRPASGCDTYVAHPYHQESCATHQAGEQAWKDCTREETTRAVYPRRGRETCPSLSIPYSKLMHNPRVLSYMLCTRRCPYTASSPLTLATWRVVSRAVMTSHGRSNTSRLLHWPRLTASKHGFAPSLLAESSSHSFSFARLPPYPGVHHFPRGPTALKRLSWEEHKTIARVRIWHQVRISPSSLTSLVLHPLLSGSVSRT